MQFDLIMATQFSFLMAFLGMVGGAYYFSLIKSTLPVEHQANAVTSAVYCLMAAIMYGFINYKYGIGTDALAKGDYPTVLRYIDWLVTTPLLVNKFPEMLGGDDAPAVAILVIIADVMMILFGLAGESSINAVVGWAMFGVGSLAWLFIIFVLYTAVTNASANKLGPVKVGLSRLKLFIVFGWAIYPLGFLITLISNSPDVRIGRELIYNVADLFNKVGFGMVAIYAVRQIVREQKIREAMPALRPVCKVGF
jgi:sensory rhodopsin